MPPNHNDTPDTLYKRFLRLGVTGPRIVRNTYEDRILIYTDGACLNNGKKEPPPAGGCAFVFRPDFTILNAAGRSPGVVGFRLEDTGPTGITYPHTPATEQNFELSSPLSNSVPSMAKAGRKS